MDFSNNFWKEFPQLVFAAPIQELYSSDKTKDKSYSSKMMWAIFLVFNPKSDYYNFPNKEEIVSRDFLKDNKFKWSTVSKITEFYKTGVLTTAEQSLATWNEMMQMRDKTLKDLYKAAAKNKEEGIRDLVEIDKMMSNTAKMFADYKKIKDDFDTEKTKGKGSKVVSLADDDDI
jgi:hypothetical protein